ncbi:class I SAM-dependent methyltransferase [Marinicella rhabdoformis]|uniref:class I SAM-dependent methyltransferase n=1 Tax=Marinicella rhabdoformis TaxID=2580566 RepID=UPI0012AEC173|nr:class I SAM-dependent methyltransferase [Marinicella rhabdoformis]
MTVSAHLNALGVDSEQILAQLPKTLTLSLSDGVLFLQDSQNPKLKATVDFLKGRLAYRSQQHINGENLVKACRIKGQNNVSVLDATCGFGKDAFLLSCAGFEVTATESNPVVCALLQDALHRYLQETGLTPFKLHLNWAQKLTPVNWPQVIYLDPMFPEREKSAAVKKDMQLFHRLHGLAAQEVEQLLKWALDHAEQKVVIKRPVRSKIVNNLKPTYQITGKSCRFDVYQCK